MAVSGPSPEFYDPADHRHFDLDRISVMQIVQLVARYGGKGLAFETVLTLCGPELRRFPVLQSADLLTVEKERCRGLAHDERLEARNRYRDLFLHDHSLNALRTGHRLCWRCHARDVFLFSRPGTSYRLFGQEVREAGAPVFVGKSDIVSGAYEGDARMMIVVPASAGSKREHSVLGGVDDVPRECRIGICIGELVRKDRGVPGGGCHGRPIDDAVCLPRPVDVRPHLS